MLVLASFKLELLRSNVRECLAESNKLEGGAYNDEIRAEERASQDKLMQLEQHHRSTLLTEDRDLEQRRAGAGTTDPE